MPMRTSQQAKTNAHRRYILDCIFNLLSLLIGILIWFCLYAPKNQEIAINDAFDVDTYISSLLNTTKQQNSTIDIIPLIIETLTKMQDPNWRKVNVDYYRAEEEKLKRELSIKINTQMEMKENCLQHRIDFTKVHNYHSKLAHILKEYYNNVDAKTVGDIGCVGKCEYVETLRNASISATGFVFDRTGMPEFVKEMDLNARTKLEERFDFIQSIGAGEHIFVDFEDSFIDNIALNAQRGAVVSWAVIGQDGYMHVNNRDNDYIIKKFEERGFTFMNEDTHFFRKELRNHFGNTIMIFFRK